MSKEVKVKLKDGKEIKVKNTSVAKAKKTTKKKEDICSGCSNNNCRNKASRPELVEKCAYLHGYITSYVE